MASFSYRCPFLWSLVEIFPLLSVPFVGTKSILAVWQTFVRLRFVRCPLPKAL